MRKNGRSALTNNADNAALSVVVLGSGKRLFGTGTVPVALKQVESVTSGKGATYHRFERGGKPTYGQMGA
jgi:hypothetical protein